MHVQIVSLLLELCCTCMSLCFCWNLRTNLLSFCLPWKAASLDFLCYHHIITWKWKDLLVIVSELTNSFYCLLIAALKVFYHDLETERQISGKVLQKYFSNPVIVDNIIDGLGIFLVYYNHKRRYAEQLDLGCI